MAVALDGSIVRTTSPTNSSTTITQSVTVGSGSDRVLVALVGIGRSTTSVSSIVYNGSENFVSYGRVTGASFSSCEVWVLVNPTVTTANVVITPASGSTSWYWGASIYSFNGVDQTTPVEFAGKGAASATISDSVSTYQTGDYLVDLVTVNNTGHTLTATGSQTADFATIDLGPSNDQESRGSSNTTDATMSWSGLASDDSSHVIARVLAVGNTIPLHFIAAGTVAQGANSAANPTTLAPGIPAGTAVNDVLLCFSWCRSITATVSTPSGWTLQSSYPLRSATASGGSWYVFAKVVVGGETAPSVSWSGVTTGTTGDHAEAVIVAYRNVDVSGGAGALLDGTPQKNDQAAATTTATIPSVTTAVDGSVVVGAVVKLQDLAGTWTPPASWTERADNGSTNASGGYREIADFTKSPAGASGAVTAAPSSATSARALGTALALLAVAAAVSSGIPDVVMAPLK